MSNRIAGKLFIEESFLSGRLWVQHEIEGTNTKMVDGFIMDAGMGDGTEVVIHSSPGRFTICTPEIAVEIERREQIYRIIEFAMNRPGELLGKKIKITHKNDPTETVCSIYFVGGVEQLLVIQALKIGTQEPMSILPLCYLLDSHHAMTIELID